MRFDLTDLRLFVNIADTGSITHGAARTHMALASASARIRGMEETLGTSLLQRQHRGVRPTAAGRALVHHARTVLQQLERMRGELGDYARGLKGHVRLLSNTAALTEFLPEALASFLARHSNIDIDLEERLSYDIVRAVAEGLADIGIVADTVDAGDLETFPFGIDRLVLVVPRNHPLAGRRRLAFRETLDHEFIGLGQGSALQAYLAQHAARAGGALKLRVRLGSFEAVCRMVEQGVGITVIPQAAAQRCRGSMAIGIVRLTDSWTTRRLVVCVRRFDELPAHARLLVEHLQMREASSSVDR